MDTRITNWRNAWRGSWHVLGIISLFLLWTRPAWANQPPGPQMVLAEVLILPLMMLFTALGGGYAVMRALGIKRRPWVGIFAVVAVLLSFMQEGFAFLLMFVFGLLALTRGARLIIWGMRPIRPPDQRAAHLARASSGRLIAAGLMTGLAAVALAGMSFAFLGWWPFEEYVEKDLKRLVAYELVKGKEHKDFTGNPHYEPAQQTEAPGGLTLGEHTFPFLRDEKRGGGRYFVTEFRVGPETRSFQVWAWPKGMPFFSSNYLVTLPSFYADETGQMRVIHVYRNGQKCPPNAAVYYRVGPQDLEAQE